MVGEILPNGRFNIEIFGMAAPSSVRRHNAAQTEYDRLAALASSGGPESPRGDDHFGQGVKVACGLRRKPWREPRRTAA
jgi:hypothetical protein